MDSLLKELKLARIRMIYKDYIEKANKDEISYYDFLKNLLLEELAGSCQDQCVLFTGSA